MASSAERLRVFLEKRNLSVSDLSWGIGIPQRWINDILDSKKELSPYIIDKIKMIFAADLNEFK